MASKRMKARIKKFLYKLLGTKKYLHLLQRIFWFTYTNGLLKNREEFTYHYFVKNLIKPGDVVVDLGANLGYFTRIFSSIVGPSGKVMAIEPIPLYNEILQGKYKYNNVQFFPFALGKEKKKVHLVTPDNFGYLRSGLPHVYDEKGEKPLTDFEFSFAAQMVSAKELFETFGPFQYLKCDIEGYEEVVIPEILSILQKHKPIVQIETWGTHKPIVEKALFSIGYEKYFLDNGELRKPRPQEEDLPGDFIFKFDK